MAAFKKPSRTQTPTTGSRVGQQDTFVADSGKTSRDDRRKLVLDLVPELLVDEALDLLGFPAPGADAALAERTEQVGQLDVLLKAALKKKQVIISFSRTSFSSFPLVSTRWV